MIILAVLEGICVFLNPCIGQSPSSGQDPARLQKFPQSFECSNKGIQSSTIITSNFKLKIETWWSRVGRYLMGQGT